jgi:hypothetical protein
MLRLLLCATPLLRQLLWQHAWPLWLAAQACLLLPLLLAG